MRLFTFLYDIPYHQRTFIKFTIQGNIYNIKKHPEEFAIYKRQVVFPLSTLLRILTIKKEV